MAFEAKQSYYILCEYVYSNNMKMSPNQDKCKAPDNTCNDQGLLLMRMNKLFCTFFT